MDAIRCYGFIVYYDRTGSKYSYIGSIYSTEDVKQKPRGDVSFKPENLTFDPPMWNTICLVSYIQKILPGRKAHYSADDIRLVGMFARQQYNGRFTVNGLGVVTFREATTGSTFILNDNQALSTDTVQKEPAASSAEPDPAGGRRAGGLQNQLRTDGTDDPLSPKEERKDDRYSVGQVLPFKEIELPIALPVDCSDLNCTIGKAENGDLYAQIRIPKERFTASDAAMQTRIGVVNYYTPAGAYCLLRTHYKNLLYGQDELPEPPLYMTPSEADFSVVGTVNTNGGVYFVSYNEAERTIPHPKEPEVTLSVAENVRFLCRVVSAFLYRIVVEDGTVCLSVLLRKETQNTSQTPKRILTEPVAGQTPEAYINAIVFQCLKNGTVEPGLDMVERYRDRVNEQTYYNARYRLLLRYCKDNPDTRNLRDTITCIDHLLTYSAKPNFALSLLIDKGNKQLQLADTEGAEATFREWMRQYRAYVGAHPEEEAGLATNYRMVQSRLSGAEDAEENISAIADAESSDMPDDSMMDDHIREILNDKLYSCSEVFGPDYAVFDDLKALSEEDVERLKAFLEKLLESVPTADAKMLWSAAKLLHALNEAPVQVLEEEERILKRDTCIRQALYKDARMLLDDMSSGSLENSLRQRNQALYDCLLALSYYVGDKEVTAAAGTACLKPEEYQQTLAGRMDLTAVLKKAFERSVLSNTVYAMVLLGGRNRSVRDLLAAMLKGCAATIRPEIYEALKLALKDFADGSEGSPAELLESAAIRFEDYVKSFLMTPDTGSFTEIADAYIRQFDEAERAGWTKREMVKIPTLREMFRHLSEYEGQRGFENKSPILTGFLKDLRGVLGTIAKYPSVFSMTCYQVKFEGLEDILTGQYKKLCQTTKPIIRIDEEAQIDQSADGKGGMTLLITLNSSRNYVQNATGVRLFVTPEDNQSYSFGAVQDLPDEIPCDGRRVQVRVPVKQKRKTELITFRVRLVYNYISDISIRYRDRVSKRHRVIAETEAVIGTSGVPSINGWMSMSVAPKEITRHALSLDRVQKFKSNGKLEMKDPEIRGILKNREKIVETAIDYLTIPGTDEQGQSCRFPDPVGSWVIEHGQWRSGKTVVMHMIEERLQDSARFSHIYVLYVDLSAVHSQKAEGDADSSDEVAGKKASYDDAIATKIFFGLKKVIRNKMKERPEDWELFVRLREECAIPDAFHPVVTWDVFCAFLEEFINGMRERDRAAGVALMVDEFTDIYSGILGKRVDAGFLKRWVAMIAQTGVICVTAGGEHMKAMLQTYVPNAQQKADKYLLIDYLSKEDTKIFVRYVLGEAWDDRIEPDMAYLTGEKAEETFDKIYDLTRGSTYLLKLLCTWLIDYLLESGQKVLTASVVLQAVDDHIKKSGIERDQMETQIFHSLYDPFREKDVEEQEEESADVMHIEDDAVSRENLMILHEIVRLANPEQDNHLCPYTELKSACSDLMGQEALFERRFRTLQDRRIVILDPNDNVSIFVDLYYEVMSRLDRKENA